VTHPLFELGIHRIECPVPFPQAGGPANVYVLEEADGGVALFDSGLGTREGEEAVQAGFTRLGLKFGDVRRIYLSHGHIDHYGLARTISEASGADVYIHEADRLKVERPQAEWKASRSAYREYLHHLGVSPAEIEKLEQMHQYTLSLARPVERTKAVREGDVLRFKHFSATVQHAPGHTPGLTCLYVEAHRLLFSDDHLLERVSPNPLLEVGPEGPEHKFRSLVTYLSTLERTRELAMELVLPGHNEPFRNPVPIIDWLRGFYEKRQTRILEALATGPKTAVELVTHVFPRLGLRDLFLTLSEIVGNLEVLEDRGQVVRRAPAPVYRWEQVSPG
jgi:glyoxylase-like metal-dependent hydrolase (beta-lactamase superfamily II)